jgi:hypothetical protein
LTSVQLQSYWLTNREAAIYARLKGRKAGFRTINRWARTGLIPKEFVGGDRDLLVQPRGVDIALQKLRQLRLRRCGIREVA